MFNELKTTQVAAILLRLDGGSMNYMKLLKIMYYIERASLLKWGRPVSYDTISSLPHGIVPSTVYGFIKRSKSFFNKKTSWDKHIARLNEYDVKLKNDPGIDELSEIEISLIKKVYEEKKIYNQWELSDQHHELPEYVDPGESSVPLDYEYILQKSGIDDEAIKFVSQQLKSIEYLNNMCH